MEELSRRVGNIWRACDSPSRKNSTSHLFWLVQTLSKLFTPVPTCSHLFTPVHTFLHLFTPVHTFTHLFPPVHPCSHLSDYLCSSHSGSFSLNFPLAKAVFFYLLCYLVEIAYFCLLNREISSGIRAWVTELKKCRSLWQPILQWPCTLVAQCHFFHFRML